MAKGGNKRYYILKRLGPRGKIDGRCRKRNKKGTDGSKPACDVTPETAVEIHDPVSLSEADFERLSRDSGHGAFSPERVDTTPSEITDQSKPASLEKTERTRLLESTVDNILEITQNHDAGRSRDLLKELLKSTMDQYLEITQRRETASSSDRSQNDEHTPTTSASSALPPTVAMFRTPEAPKSTKRNSFPQLPSPIKTYFSRSTTTPKTYPGKKRILNDIQPNCTNNQKRATTTTCSSEVCERFDTLLESNKDNPAAEGSPITPFSTLMKIRETQDRFFPVMNPKWNESQCGQGILKALSPFAPAPTKSKANDSVSKDPSSEKNTFDSHLLNDQNLSLEKDSSTGETKQDKLKTKFCRCENLEAQDSFRKHTENDLENTIAILEAENSELKYRLNELELTTVNLLAENESQGKEIEHLISEKVALEVLVDKLKTLDDYTKVLEKERCAFVEVERERDHLRIQVLKEKEKSKEVVDLQQFVKKLTKECDALNAQLWKQQDAAEIAVKQVSNELKEEKELSNKLLVLANQLYAQISLLKKIQLILFENKEFYKKKFNVRLSNLNRQMLEMESAKSRLSESSKMFDSTLRQIKMILSVAEHFNKTGRPPNKLVLLFKILQAALVRLSSEIEGIWQSLPKLNDDKKEHVQLRSYSDSKISVKALTVKKTEPFLSVKSVLIGLCAGNRALVEKLFSAENLNGNEDMEIAKINANVMKQSSHSELERKNFWLKTEQRKNDSVVTINLDKFEDLVIPYLLQRMSYKNSASALHISFKPCVNYLRAFTSAFARKLTESSRLKPKIKLNDRPLRECEKPSRNECVLEKDPNQVFTPSDDSNLNMAEVTQSYRSQKSLLVYTDPRNTRFTTPSLKTENFDSERVFVIQDGVKYVPSRNDVPDGLRDEMTETCTLLRLASDFECPVKNSAGKNTEILRFMPLKNAVQEASKYSLVARTPAMKDQICKIRELSEIFAWFMSAREVYLRNTLSFLLSPLTVHDRRLTSMIHASNFAVFNVSNVEIELSAALQLPEVTSESAKSFENLKEEIFSQSTEIYSKTFNSVLDEVMKCNNKKYSLELTTKSSTSDHLSGAETLEREKNSDDLKFFEKFVGSNSDSNLIDDNTALQDKYYQKSVEKTEQSNSKSGENFDGDIVRVLKKKDDCNHMSSVQFSFLKRSKFSNKSEKKKNWFFEINALRLKNFKLRKCLLNFKMEAASLKSLISISDFEKSEKKLNEIMVEENERDCIVDNIKKEYEQRIAELTERYEGKLTEVKNQHNKDFKSLSQIYVDKLKRANEIHAQSIESTEELNLCVLKDYQNFYDAEIEKWETLMDQYSQKLLHFKNAVAEADEKMNAQLLNAVNNYESLLHRVCEAFENEKAAIYAIVSESLKKFEDDYKGNLRKIAAKLDSDSVILHRLFEKELGRCKRKYESNLKQQKNSYKILLEEARLSYEKKVSQKSQLTFSKILVCNCEISQVCLVICRKFRNLEQRYSYRYHYAN